MRSIEKKCEIVLVDLPHHGEPRYRVIVDDAKPLFFRQLGEVFTYIEFGRISLTYDARY